MLRLPAGRIDFKQLKGSDFWAGELEREGVTRIRVGALSS